MLYIYEKSLVTTLIFSLLRVSLMCSFDLNTYLFMMMLTFLNEMISFYVSFTARTVSSALITFFYISSQMRSFTTLI